MTLLEDLVQVHKKREKVLDSKSMVKILGNPAIFPADQRHTGKHDFYGRITDLKENLAERENMRRENWQA